jgi:hypothetical protein
MWLIRPGVVLHKRLQDFSVGHAYLLEALESPFMLGGRVAFYDLVVAVLVCSMPFAKARKYLMRPLSRIRRDAERWGFWCRLRGFDIDKATEAFREYIGAYHDMADPYRDKKSKPGESCLPEAVRIAWALMERMSEDEAWNCPMARALTYYTAQAEYNGQKFMTETEARKLKVI